MKAIFTSFPARDNPRVRAIPAAIPLAVLLVFLPRMGRALDRPPDTSAPPSGGATSPQAVRVVPLPPHTLDVRIWTNQSYYQVNDDVQVLFWVNRDATVYIFNTDASGQKRQLFPNAQDRNNWVQGGVTYAIPDATYRLVATGPEGWESLHIVAYASHQIFFPQYDQFPDPVHRPYPDRPEGAQLLLGRLRADQAAAAKAAATAPSSGTEPQASTVVVQPPVPPAAPDYGDAKAFFYVGSNVPNVTVIPPDTYTNTYPQTYPETYPTSPYYYDYSYPYYAYPYYQPYYYSYGYFPYYRFRDHDDFHHSHGFGHEPDHHDFGHFGNQGFGHFNNFGNRFGGGGFGGHAGGTFHGGFGGHQGGFQGGFHGGDGHFGGGGGGTRGGGGMRGGGGGGGGGRR